MSRHREVFLPSIKYDCRFHVLFRFVLLTVFVVLVVACPIAVCFDVVHGVALHQWFFAPIIVMKYYVMTTFCLC